MRTRVFVPILALSLLAACHKSPPKQVALNSAFHTIPLPPDAQALVSEGGSDAMQLVLVTPMMPDAVVDFYRKTLSADPFHLVNETASGKGTALYAEQDNGPPIWVTVGPNGKEGSQVVLAGAKDPNAPEADPSAKVKTADSGGAVQLPVKKP